MLGSHLLSCLGRLMLGKCKVEALNALGLLDKWRIIHRNNCLKAQVLILTNSVAGEIEQ
jgi:hypothetical protein